MLKNVVNTIQEMLMGSLLWPPINRNINKDNATYKYGYLPFNKFSRLAINPNDVHPDWKFWDIYGFTSQLTFNL